MRLQVIVGSTRPGRAADKVVPWVVGRAAQLADFELEVLDLRDWPLPMFGEHMGSIGDRADPTYSDELVRHWNRKIAEGPHGGGSTLSRRQPAAAREAGTRASDRRNACR